MAAAAAVAAPVTGPGANTAAHPRSASDQTGDERLRVAWEEVKQWNELHTPQNTRRTYETYRRQFHEWCGHNGFRPVPADPIAVARFIQFCATDERTLGSGRALSKGTITHAVPSAIADEHKRAGLQSPTSSPIVAMALRTAQRAAPHGRGSKRPLTTDLLKRMFAAPLSAGESELLRLRNRSLVLLMQAAFLRESEAVALRASDVSVEKWPVSGHADDGRGGAVASGGAGGGGGGAATTTNVLLIRIVRSKTDQFERGDTVVVADNDGDRCLRPTQTYVEWRDQHELSTLFDEAAESEWAFPDLTTGRALSPDTPRGIIKRWLSAIGEDPTLYGGHSARSGGATSAASQGIAMHLLKRHGRWRSDAVYVYIHDSVEDRIAVSRAALAE